MEKTCPLKALASPHWWERESVLLHSEDCMGMWLPAKESASHGTFCFSTLKTSDYSLSQGAGFWGLKLLGCKKIQYIYIYMYETDQSAFKVKCKHFQILERRHSSCKLWWMTKWTYTVHIWRFGEQATGCLIPNSCSNLRAKRTNSTWMFPLCQNLVPSPDSSVLTGKPKPSVTAI